MLAALDALEQEGVVGVLGDLEERRHRRQQVGDDLLADRHERAARGQLDELFERRLLHTGVPASVLTAAAMAASRRSAASRRTRASGVTPVHHANCADGLGDEHVEAVEGAAAGRRGVAQQPRRPRVVDEVVDQRAVEPDWQIGGVDRRSIDVGIGADRRGVDQQIPAAPRHRPRPAAPAPRCGRRHVGGQRPRRLGPTGVHGDAGAARHQAAHHRARRSAGADDRRAPAPSTSPAERRQEAFDVGVGAVPAAVAPPQRVERAALPGRARRVVLERRGHAGAGDVERRRRGRGSRRSRPPRTAGRRRRCRSRRTRRCASPATRSGRSAGRRRRRPASTRRRGRRGTRRAAVDRDLPGRDAVAAVGPARADVLGQDARGDAGRPHGDDDRALRPRPGRPGRRR